MSEEKQKKAHRWMNRRNVLIFIRRNESKNENEHAEEKQKKTREESVVEERKSFNTT